MPRTIATTGLTYVNSGARAGPTSAMRAKNTMNATAVHRMPSATSETVLRVRRDFVLRQHADRQVEEPDGGERERDRAERGHVLELRRHDERRDRIAGRPRSAALRRRGDSPLPRRPSPGPATMTATPANPMTSPAARAGRRTPLSPRVKRDDGREQRDGRDEQSGEPRRKRLLGMTEQQERTGHLDRAERQHPRPELQGRAESAAVQRDGQQDERADAAYGPRRRREVSTSRPPL